MTKRYTTILHVAILALASVWYNLRLSIFTSIIYAAIVAPVIVLYLLKNGVITAWSEDLSKDVQSREIDIRGEYSSRLTQAELNRLREMPGTDFIVGEAMNLVSTRQMRRVSPERGPPREIKVRTTALGDPLLLPDLLLLPTDLVLSARAANRLEAGVGDRVAFTLRRKQNVGGIEVRRIAFNVVHVVDARKWPSEAVFVLPGVAVAMGHWIGSSLEDVDAIQEAVAEDVFRYASFRIYAQSVHDATGLMDALVNDGYEATLRVAEVSRMMLIERGLNLVFNVLLSLSVAGLIASILLLQWLSVERQKQELALLLTAGFSRQRIRAFVFGQALILSCLGLLIAVALSALAFRGLAPIVLQQVDLAADAIQWPGALISFLALSIGIFTFSGVSWLAVGRMPLPPLVAALRSD